MIKSLFSKSCRLVISIVCFSFFLCWGHSVMAQSESGITLNMDNVSLETVIDAIEHQSRYLFLNDQVDLNKIVSVHALNQPIGSLLNQMFRNSGIVYKVDDTNVYISYKKASEAEPSMQISGWVIDKDGGPLIGANIVLKRTGSGCTTDMDGKFYLPDVSYGDEIIVSYIGYISKTLKINSNGPLSIVLMEDTNALEQVMVIGYATGSKHTISGAVEHVGKKDMNKGVIVSPTDALKGKVSGVIISQSGGDPMGTTNIRIRGTSSLSGGNTPLIIIDGVFGDLNTLNSLSANDIQSVTVLKDASETAQYGSRGAAGVIVVSTTHGKSGGAEVDYEGQFGVNSVFRNLDMMSASEYRSKANSLGSTFTDMGGDTDWLKEIENKTSITQNHHISFTSGTDISSMRASLGVAQREGAVKNSDMINYTAKFDAMQYALEKRLKLELGSFASSKKGNVLYDSRELFYSAAAYNPTYPDEKNSDGVWDEDLLANEVFNPLGQLEITDNVDKNLVNVHGKATLQIIDGLDLSFFGSYTYSDNESKYYIPNDIRQGETNGNGVAHLQNTIDKSLMGHIQLDYSKDLGKHHIDALALMEDQKYNTFYHGEQCTGFETNYFKYNNLKAGANISWGNLWSNYSSYTLLSYMGRLNYVYDNRYIITGNIRYDGSSKLGNGNKWGFFPSASAGWIISNESFMKDVKWINNLKLRVGYGVTGNQDAIKPYNSLELYEPNGTTLVDGATTTTYSVASNSNPDLKWEVKQMFDAGLDLSVFGSRLNVTADYYYSKTKDLLYDYTVPVPPFVYTTLLANIGSMTNNGFEFSASGDIIRTHDFTFGASMNWSFQKNKLISLHGTYKGQTLTPSEHIAVANVNAAGLTQNTGVSYLIEGQPIGVFYVPHCTGIDKNGQYILEDIDGNGTVDTGDSGDRYVAGQAIPKTYMGLNLSVRYKNWDLSAQFDGAFGHKIYDGSGMTYSNFNNFPTYNLLSSAKDENGGKGIYDIQISDYWLKKGDYVNFEYASLGYTFDTKKLGINRIIKSLRLAFSVNNICTITGYQGLTPMINSASLIKETEGTSTYGTLGVDDKWIYPLTRTSLFTLSFKF